MSSKRVANWGNYPSVEAEMLESRDLDRIREHITGTSKLIARGNGRCYGDASLSKNIVSSLPLNRFLSFDIKNGVIECESGVMLSEVLAVCVPNGFFLPVTPGTKFITVGGAIAADVHGKNHHVHGSFSNFVEEIVLLDETGRFVVCSGTREPEIFWKTCGGMGRTGIIISAKIRLRAIESSYIEQTSYKARDLCEIMELFEENLSSTYSVAWIDCFAKGQKMGRSILLLGEHISGENLPIKYKNEPLLVHQEPRLNFPFTAPSSTVNYLTVKILNALYYSRQRGKVSKKAIHYDPYFYPLDRINNWNRAYGKRGFVQYQCVIPLEQSKTGMEKLLAEIEHSGQGSPLAVLKLFGEADPNAVMSFPMKGYTLALDFKVSERVFSLLDKLDRIVADLGGRVYLAKDARMNAEVFGQTYKKQVSSAKFASLQSERLGY
ncbi:FAD-dependent oxidoreductase [Leptolyngbya sp. 7M]|uniref:FAD-binding oxidoreductase n=1 Tax=Leptolyngbya sp. 7M TaxID=2812896 RepID=UPI001B8B6784|nr:FAD-binding oxidoreductase [Leptolyngbya sp. 7M]QYO65879.1 FAD-binding oxidoreductase [Leptolyngbya sp. 7M]